MKSKLFILLSLVLNACVFASDKCADVQFYSQAQQDQFVHHLFYNLAGKKSPGTFLEIGCAHPIKLSNTYALEKSLGWDGYSIDISNHHQKEWNETRKRPMVVADATTLNYKELLKNAPLAIDYLSLDVDSAYVQALKKVLQSGHLFKVITIEHDFYRFGDMYKSKEREILKKHGYQLVCADVCSNGSSFEDWWIHPKFFSKELSEKLSNLKIKNLNHKEIIKRLNFLQ